MNLFLFLMIHLALAEDKSSTPYLDKLKASLDSEEASSAGYSEEIKQKLDSKVVQPSSKDYTQKIKTTLEPINDQEESYTDSIKKGLEPTEEVSAIEAVKLGQSDLKLVRSTDIKSALGFRIGASVSRNYSGEAVAFSTIYPTAFSPDFTLHYEWKPFHSEWLGSLGVAVEAGLQSFRGTGVFKWPLTNPVTGASFSSTSRVSTQLMIFPFLTGLVYRFNLLRIIRPYVQAGPMALVLAETRSDTDRVMKSFSTGWYGIGGVSILLDGLSREMTWDLYAVHSVKHYYITAEYFFARPLTGDVQMSAQGIYAGFLMEM